MSSHKSITGGNFTVVDGKALPTPTVRGYTIGHLLGKGTYGYVFHAKKLVFYLFIF